MENKGILLVPRETLWKRNCEDRMRRSMEDRTRPEAEQHSSGPERQIKKRRSRARTRAKCYPAGSYDVAVVGAGHAGVEAALAAALSLIHI